MIDAVIRNMIKFIKILPALITLLKILEDTHMHKDTCCIHAHIHTHTGWCRKKKKHTDAEKFSINP